MDDDAAGQVEDAYEGVHQMLDFLVRIYRTLQDLWTESFMDRVCAPDAPWSQVLESDLPDDQPLTAAEKLIWAADEAAVVTAQSVGHHLGLLARAYWLDPFAPEGPPSTRWPYSAPYAPARAIAEGTAMIRWILAHDADRHERVCRAARLWLWSDAAEWEPVAREAGLKTERETRADGSAGAWFVRLDETSRPLSQNALMKLGHGREGPKVYGRWSPLVHHSPRATFRGASYRAEPGHGAFLGSLLQEDKHLSIARDVINFVAEAARQQGRYYGRDVSDVTEFVVTSTANLDEALPLVEAQVRERDAQQYG